MHANDRSIATLTMLGHGLVHWFELSIPIFLVIWLDEFAIGVTLAGLVVALGYAPFGFGALPAGVLVDRYGPEPLILGCLAGMTLSFLALALASTIWSVGLALVLWGIAASVYHPAGMALISTGARERGTVFAWHGIAGNTGIALGPFATATLLVFFGWQSVAAVLALPGLLALLYGWGLEFDPTAAVEDEPESEPALSLSAVLANSRHLVASAFLVVFLLVSFEGLFYRGMLTYLPEILSGLPAMQGLGVEPRLRGIQPSDYVYVGLLVVGMAGQYAGGKLTDRIPVERGLAVLFGVLAVLAVGFVPVTGLGLVPLVLLCGTVGFFLFAIQPFYQVAVAVYTPPDTRGLSYGYTYLGEFGFGAASIAIGGFALGTFRLGAFFLVLAAFAVCGGALALLLVVGDSRFGFVERYETEPAG